jgi:dimeric dUTPase (all-alpha-NTP-PPase superfamily)
VFDNGVEIGPYEVWHEAFLATQEAVGERTSDAKSLKQGRERAAIEVARGAAEVYTDFVNGCIYVVNVEVHRALTESDDPTETDLEDAFNEDQLFGQQVAESELQKEFNRIVKEEKDSLAAKVRH